MRPGELFIVLKRISGAVTAADDDGAEAIVRFLFALVNRRDPLRPLAIALYGALDLDLPNQRTLRAGSGSTSKKPTT